MRVDRSGESLLQWTPPLLRDYHNNGGTVTIVTMGERSVLRKQRVVCYVRAI